MLSVFLVCLFGGAHGHMGITVPEAREKAVVNDAYRYPNLGHCHGVGPKGPGKEYAAGSTVTLQLSGGAAHNGGHCALFLARRSDQETVWFKQMDDIDCTLKASFAWQIQASLVPSECGQGDGCTLIWAWTPTSSGACEIYMNCFDVKITSTSGYGGDAPDAITINKDPVCSRVDAAKKTAHFGTYCGTSCVQGGNTVTSPPTLSGATSAPTPASTTPSGANPFRCGDGWVDANLNCKETCLSDADCKGIDTCFADMQRSCTTATQAPTAAANVGSPTAQTSSSCRAVGLWAGSPGMNKWCATNCPNICPSSHCECDSAKLFYVDQNKGTYVPDCQTKTVDGTETIRMVALEYDLSSYRIDHDDGGAALDLLKYNQGCQPELATATIDTMLTAGQSLYITGDCQLTSFCTPVDQSTANRLSVSVAMMVTLGVMLLASL